MNELITDPEDPRIKVGAKFHWAFDTKTSETTDAFGYPIFTVVRFNEAAFTIDGKIIRVNAVRATVKDQIPTGSSKAERCSLYLVEEAPDLDKPIRDSILKTVHDSLNLGSWFNAGFAQTIIDDLRKLDLLPKV